MKHILTVLFLIIFMSACTTTRTLEVPVEVVKEVPVEVVKTEYINNTLFDTVIQRDSVDRYRDGDTVYIYKEHVKYQLRTRLDSIIKTDTIPKIVKVEVPKVVKQETVKEVNKLKWYQKTLMWIGGIISLLSLVYIVYKVKFK